MSDAPTIYILAGPNGSGKTILARDSVAPPNDERKACANKL